MTNRYGIKFEEGKTYHCEGEPSFGVKGNGFHFCLRLEDTLRYYPTIKRFNRRVFGCALEEISIASVIGKGKIAEGYDDYNGYYDLYVATSIEIVHILSREEILTLASEMSDPQLIRFLSGFQLVEEEWNRFRDRNESVNLAIDYYQRGIDDSYTNRFGHQKTIGKRKIDS